MVVMINFLQGLPSSGSKSKTYLMGDGVMGQERSYYSLAQIWTKGPIQDNCFSSLSYTL